MGNYFSTRKQEILKTFEGSPVVLVELFSDKPEWNGKIVAISENCGGYPSISQAVAAGLFEDGMQTSFGVTTACLDLMELQETMQHQTNKKMPMIDEKFVEQNFGCLLSIFLGLIVFILWCLFTGW